MTEGTRYVVLLRGVNVGGRTTVAMSALRRTCEAVGCTDVMTYIQSGNVVLSSDLAEGALREVLERAISDELGVHSAVLVRTAAEMAAVLRNCPYPESTRDHVHVAFASEPPDADRLAGAAVAPEEATAVGREVYLYLPNGLGRSKLPVELNRRLTPQPTVRNWRTVTRLAEMATA